LLLLSLTYTAYSCAKSVSGNVAMFLTPNHCRYESWHIIRISLRHGLHCRARPCFSHTL